MDQTSSSYIVSRMMEENWSAGLRELHFMLRIVQDAWLQEKSLQLNLYFYNTDAHLHLHMHYLQFIHITCNFYQFP